MSGRIEALVRRYQGRDLLIDSNLLLLFLVGKTDPSYIKAFDRTQAFEVSDFNDVTAIVTGFAPRIVTTPYILAEVSNLANKLKGDRREQFYRKFGEWIGYLTEVSVNSAEICRLDKFDVFGLTDLGVLHHSRGGRLVLTDDGRLSHYLQAQNVDVLTLAEIHALNQGHRPR